MAQQIQVRRGTAAQATSANPILASGEIGFETDTGLFKIGNGVGVWTALSYAGGGGGGATNLDGLTDVVITAAATGDIIRYNGTAWVDVVGTSFFDSAGAAAAAQAASQPVAANLTALAGLTSAANKGMQFTGSGTAAVFDLTAAGKALLDDADAAAQRTTLGLGTVATQAASAVAITGGTVTGITDVTVADGGTGSSTAAGARTNLGLVIDTDVTAKATFDAHLADTTDAHDASAVSVLDTAGDYTGTNVETVLAELPTKFAGTTTTINAQTGTTYTFQLTDDEVTGDNTAAQIYTVPPNASVPFPIGRGFGLTNLNTGDITITAGVGVTFVPTGDKLLFGVGQFADFFKIGTNTWSVILSGTNDTELVAIAGVTSAADKVPYFTGAGTASVATFTNAARLLTAAVDASAQRSQLGLVIGTDVAAPSARVTFSNAAYTVVATRQTFVAQTGTMSASRIVTLPAASAFRAGDVLTIYDESGSVTATNTLVITRAGGDTIAGATTVTIAAAYGWRRLVSDGSSKWSFDGGVLRSASNLSDLTDASAARTNLGLGTAATTAATAYATAAQGATADAAVPTAQSINAQTGTTYTLVAGDAGKLVSLSNAAAITLTLPQDSDATIAVGVYVDLYQLGAGQVTVAAGTGATLRTSGLTAKARAQYSRLGVQKVSANTWSLMGDLAAS